MSTSLKYVLLLKMASTMTLTVEVLEYFLASSYLVKWRNWTEWKDHVVDDIEIEDDLAEYVVVDASSKIKL